MRAEEALTQGVQRARSDVAVYDAERRECEWKQAVRTLMPTGGMRFGQSGRRLGHKNLQSPTGLADGLEVGVLYRTDDRIRPWTCRTSSGSPVSRMREFGDVSIIGARRPTPTARGAVLTNFL